MSVSSLVRDLIKAVEDCDWFSVDRLVDAIKAEISVFMLENYGENDGAIATYLNLLKHTVRKRCNDTSKKVVCEMWIKEIVNSLGEYGLFGFNVNGNPKKALKQIAKRLSDLSYEFAPSPEFRTSDKIKEESKVARELDDVLDSLTEILMNSKVENKTIVQLFKVIRDRVAEAKSLLREYMANPREVKNKQAFIGIVMEISSLLRDCVKLMEDYDEILVEMLSKQLGVQLVTDVTEVVSKEEKEESKEYSTLADLLSLEKLPDWVDDEWKELLTHPIVVLIMGHTGQGKSALLYSIAEVMHIMYGLDVYFIWPDPNRPVSSTIRRALPKWIKIIEPKGDNVSAVLDEVPNNAIVIIDEAFIAFGARTSMKDPLRPLLQKAIELKRHKNISLLFVSQRARNIDVSVLNGLDLLMIKRPQEMQVRTDRSEVREYLQEALAKFKALPTTDPRPFVYVVDLRTGKKVMKKFGLASFWSEEISHMFA